ncbi:MAG: hypothetical protein N3G75_07660 [Methanothrix sp.]|nr:hypothetical protein [Methanothrix sp.]MCX8207690.1 hypothetical protein [Methanothrix sp.]
MRARTILMEYVVVRRFQRHDGKTLRIYTRGQIIPSKEAASMPSEVLENLLAGGFVYPSDGVRKSNRRSGDEDI